MLLVIVVALAFVAWRSPGIYRALAREMPELRAALAGFTVFAVIGYALNDSGIAIPALMLGVLNATLVFLAWGGRRRAHGEPDPGPDRVREPERAAADAG
jgi:hypothetical protein